MTIDNNIHLSLNLSHLFIHWQIYDRQPSRYAALVSFMNIWMWDGQDPRLFPHLQSEKLLSWLSHDDRQVRAAAWSGAVLLILRFGDKLPQFFREAIADLATDQRLRNELTEIQKYLFTSVIGAQSQTRIQHEIFDKMHQEQQKIREKLGMADDEDTRMEITEEANRKMSGYVEKLNQMAQDGIDMNLGTFSSLRGLDIFKKVRIWFLDFDINHPDLEDLGEARSLANAIFGHAELCDLDKYALSAAVNKITSIDALKKQFPPQVLDMDNEEVVRMRTQERRQNAYRYTFQTLQRFFSFSPWCKDTFNPFTIPPYLADHAQLQPFIGDSFLLESSRVFLRHSSHIHSAACLRSWMHRNGPTEETLRMLAECDRHLGENTERLECLLQLERLNPDDMQTVQETGLCLINEKRYDEALKRFFHLEVKETNLRGAARAIAWCSLMTGNKTRADRYYRKLLDWHGGPTWEDLLNAGHCAWVCGDPVEASRLYNAYLSIHQDNLQAFDNDRDTLLELGLTDNDITLMKETVM